MRIHIVLTGRADPGGDQFPGQLELPEDSHVSDAVAAIKDSLPEGESLPKSCLLAVAGRHLGTLDQHENRLLADGQELLLIAPMAGG